MKITDIIKDKLNILDVVGSYVKLEKSGKTYKGKSPFTNEKTPSFFVSPEKGFFYCFSSNKGGDMFTFIQEIERVEFKEALELLAEKAGVDVSEYRNTEHTSSSGLHYKILDDATKWYEVQLRKRPDLVEYLSQRGLSKDTLVSFRIGYALDDWSSCYRYLKSRKYDDKDIDAVGLIKKNDQGTYYDRFRNRIVFPLFDARGRVVGFSGRIVEQEGSVHTGAKYLNSPEGMLFDKSKLLYGYHTAKTEIGKRGYCILVEGQFDVLLSQQSGYINTVAISGTGLTAHHIAEIKRFTDTLYIALDADEAGVKATRRSVLEAYRHGMNVRVVVLPEGMDPADAISRSKEQWDLAVHDAQDYIDYRLLIFQRTPHSFEEKRALVMKDIFPFVLGIQSAIVQDTVLQKIALFLGVSIDAVRNDFASADHNHHEDLVVDTPPVQKTESQALPLRKEIMYLYAFLQDEGYIWDEETESLQQRRYTELYNSSLHDDIQTADSVEKNMYLFIFKERYQHIPVKTLGRRVLISLNEEYLRRIEKDSKDILAVLRQAELEQDHKKIISLQKRHQDLLQLKASLTKE